MSAMGEHRRNNRVQALHERGLRELDAYIRSRDPAALERARIVFHTTVASLGPHTPDRHVHFRNLAYTEELTYEETGAPGPLEDAVAPTVRRSPRLPPATPTGPPTPTGSDAPCAGCTERPATPPTSTSPSSGSGGPCPANRAPGWSPPPSWPASPRRSSTATA
ncbi:hypothetical protein ACIGO6_33780 [Streptomyces sp. NPDC053750]|uniref:hypothetical protein n=1 Tax=Streptomyces sp. NPDC053750 TaxID=3365714 RepID=UPI0037D80389